MTTKDEIIIEISDHGFRPEDIVIGDHYVLGGYSKLGDAPVINPGGDWSPYKPQKELQNKNGLETMNCSNYGTYNALETLGVFHNFEDFCKNFSERYSGVLTGTSRSGNSPHQVIEKIRSEIGGIPEELLPFGPDIDEWEKYYSPNPMDPALLALGKKLLEKFVIGHEWVFMLQGTPDQKHAQLELALTKGTVSVSVTAWKRRGDLYFKEIGEGDNHWVQLLRRNPEGTWRVFDHYDQVEKDLEAGYDFGFAKVYYLSRGVSKKKWSDALVEALKKVADALRLRFLSA